MSADNNRGTRLHEIDILYALGTLLAILGHSHPNDWTIFPGKWVEFIYLFHMPLFFLIAGFLFAASKRIEHTSFTKWITEKFLRLLTPYFVLSALALIPKYALEHNGFFDLTPEYVLITFLVPRQNVWGHFWFLPVLFLLYCIFGAFRKTGLMKQKMVDIFLLILTLWGHFQKPEIQWFGVRDICDFAVYFFVGSILCDVYLYKKKVLSIRVHLVLTILTLGISLALYAFITDCSCRNLIITVLMLFCCWEFGQFLKSHQTPVLDFIARYVFTFYIYSWFAQAITERIGNRFQLPWTAITPIMFVVGLLVPTAIATLYNRYHCIHCRFLDLILGIRQQE